MAAAPMPAAQHLLQPPVVAIVQAPLLVYLAPPKPTSSEWRLGTLHLKRVASRWLGAAVAESDNVQRAEFTLNYWPTYACASLQ